MQRNVLSFKTSCWPPDDGSCVIFVKHFKLFIRYAWLELSNTAMRIHDYYNECDEHYKNTIRTKFPNIIFDIFDNIKDSHNIRFYVLRV